MMLNKINAWILVIVWMGVIFYLSHQSASTSSELSTGITVIIVDFIQQIVPLMQYKTSGFTFIVRKGAHLFAYFILGFLVIRAILKSVGLNVFNATIALLICVLYAISDEVHQLFIPGRSGEVRDVLIDSVGAILGIGLYLILAKFKKEP